MQRQFIVRPAQVEDAPQIAKVHVETWQSAYQGQMPDLYLKSLSIAKRTETWERDLRDKNSKFRVFVAEKQGKVVGFIGVCPCRDIDMPSGTGEVGSIYVDRLSAGQGVGSALMEVGLDCLKKQGFKKATLWVLTSNEKTRKWYEARRWKIEGKTKTEARENFFLNEIRYEIDL